MILGTLYLHQISTVFSLHRSPAISVCSWVPCMEAVLVVDVLYEPGLQSQIHRDLYGDCQVGALESIE
jgi:hypothetical protein